MPECLKRAGFDEARKGRQATTCPLKVQTIMTSLEFKAHPCQPVLQALGVFGLPGAVGHS